MCVCFGVCVCAFSECESVSVTVNVCVPGCLYTYVCVCECVCMCVCMCEYGFVSLWVWLWESVCLCKCVSVSEWVCVGVLLWYLLVLSFSARSRDFFDRNVWWEIRSGFVFVFWEADFWFEKQICDLKSLYVIWEADLWFEKLICDLRSWFLFQKVENLIGRKGTAITRLSKALIKFKKVLVLYYWKYNQKSPKIMKVA